MRDHPDLALGFLSIALVAGGSFANLLQNLGTSGPARNQWQAARRKLSGRDRRRVAGATRRHRPVSAAEVASAHLACVAYARDVCERTPRALGRWMRIVLPALYALIAVGFIVDGLDHSVDWAKIFAFTAAAFSAAFAVTWTVVPPRFLDCLPARMDRLRTQIGDRFGPEAKSPQRSLSTGSGDSAAASVHTGQFCRYQPADGGPSRWHV